MNWDTLQQKLQTDISGNANADLAIVGTRWLLDFVKDDVAEPLDGYMDANFKGRFIGPFLAPGEINGKVYGLPIAASARALYYNKSLLAKASATPERPEKRWNDVDRSVEEAEGARHCRLRSARQKSKRTSIFTLRCGRTAAK